MAHSSGSVISMDDRRWRCKCGEIFPDGLAWLRHSREHKSDPDLPGTCHLVGCPNKGTVDEHVQSQPTEHALIGAGTWEDYAQPIETEYCLGFPKLRAADSTLEASCSISSSDWYIAFRSASISAAALVDFHKRDCTNRKPR